MRAALVLSLLAFLALSATPYVDRAVVSLKQCLCMAPQWLYLDVWIHVEAGGGAPAEGVLYWFDNGWRGYCRLGRGVDIYNTCSIPYASRGIAIALVQDGREVDRIEIWGVRVENATCTAAPALNVLNRTTSSSPPLAVVTLRSTMLSSVGAVFQSQNYTATRLISVRGLNPCDDYVVKLFFYMPEASPWRIHLAGNISSPPLTVTKTVTATRTETEIVTSTVTTTVTQRETATARETVTRVETVTLTRTYTTTELSVVREIDSRSVALAFLGVVFLGAALIILIIGGRRR